MGMALSDRDILDGMQDFQEGPIDFHPNQVEEGWSGVGGLPEDELQAVKDRIKNLQDNARASREGPSAIELAYNRALGK